jgi:magnesium-transporting ATPase (P-type)
MEEEKKPKEVLYLFNILSYLILGYFSLKFLFRDEFEEIQEMMRPSFHFFSNSTKHIEYIVKPAIYKFGSTIKQSKETVFISLISFILIWILMRYLIRNLLVMIRNSLIFETSKTKREFNLNSFGEYKTKDKQIITNFISSTVFVGSKLKVAVLSFFYGSAVYLSQRIQVWCLAISFVQLILFKTGKSFWPLLIFTFFIAYMYSLSELKKLKNDIEINGRKIKLKKGFKSRGDIVPGDIIVLKNGDESPCDLILIGVEKLQRDEEKRIIFSMNEVQVTGENAPVRKYLVSSNVEKITIQDLNVHQAIVNDRIHINDRSIAYGNSILNCDDNINVIGIASWVSRETKALSQPKSSVDYRQPSPFNGNSQNI